MHLGLIIPSSNTVMEEELGRYVTVHSTRIPLKTVDEHSLKEMNEFLIPAFELVSHCNPDVILYGCTSGSFLYRVEGSKMHTPMVTTTEAVLSALGVLGARTVSVATPYKEEINQKEKNFLESRGFTVNDIKGLGLSTNVDIGKLANEKAYDLTRSLKEADVFFVSCTNFRTFPILQRLEEEKDIPVISSNSASLWKVLRIAGESTRAPLGRLMEEVS